MMLKYRITAPDGGIYEVNAPEGATEQEIMAYAQAHHAAPSRKPLPVMKVTPNQMRGLFGGARANAVGPVINPAEDFMSAVGGAWDNMRSNQRARAARNEADAKRPIGEQIAKLPLDTVRRVGGDLQAVGDVVGVIGSPIAGITDAVLSGPFGRALAKYGPTMYSNPDLQMKDGKLSFAPVRPLNQAEAADKGKGMMNLALMAAKPAPGFKVPAKVQKPAPMASIERQAAEYVDRLATQGGADLTDVAKLPDHLTGAEAIGQKGKTGLATLARREGETGDALNAAVGARQAERPQRILDAFAEAAGVHPDAAAGDIRALVEAGRRQAGPLYEEAYAAGPIETPRLQGLMSRPSVREAMRRAYRLAAEEGESPEALGLVNIDDMNQWASEFPSDAPTPQTMKTPRGPSVAPKQGSSLSKFIADNGGIIDTDGELAAMGAGDWHKGKAYQRPIEGSVPADDMALKAWEAGYFPEFQTRPTEAQLYDVLREDLRGRRRFSRAVDQVAQDRFNAREAADEAIYRGHMGDPPPSEGEYVGRPEPKGETAFAAQPTAKTWDYVKRGLDDVLDDFRDSTTGKLKITNQSRGVINTLTALRDELKTANPAYGKALAASSDYLEAEGAFNSASRDLFNTKLTEAQFGDKLKGMSDGALQAYRGGLANGFYDMAQNGRLDPKVFKVPRVRAKLDLALGKDQAQRLIDLATDETNMLGFERRYAPNAGSITSEINAALAEQDAMPAAQEFMTDVMGGAVERGPIRALLAATLKQGQKGLDAVGPTRGMPVSVRDEAGRLLLSTPADFVKAMEAYRAWKAAEDAARARELRRLGAAGRLAIPAAGANASNAKGSP